MATGDNGNGASRWGFLQKIFVTMIVGVMGWYAGLINDLQTAKQRYADKFEHIDDVIAEYKRNGNNRIDKLFEADVAASARLGTMESKIALLQHQATELLDFKSEIDQRGSPILQSTIRDLQELKAQMRALATSLQGRISPDISPKH